MSTSPGPRLCTSNLELATSLLYEYHQDQNMTQTSGKTSLVLQRLDSMPHNNLYVY